MLGARRMSRGGRAAGGVAAAAGGGRGGGVTQLVPSERGMGCTLTRMGTQTRQQETSSSRGSLKPQWLVLHLWWDVACEFRR
jgi:hypothetical protein